MIDLSKVEVTGVMLLKWKAKTNKDPLTCTDHTVEDILYAYYLMARTIKPEITEELANKEVVTGKLISVMKAFFPTLATPQKDLDSLPKAS